MGNKKILLGYRELKIKGIWLYTGSIYDDLIIFETEENEPFVINGKETYNALIVKNSGFYQCEKVAVLSMMERGIPFDFNVLTGKLMKFSF